MSSTSTAGSPLGLEEGLEGWKDAEEEEQEEENEAHWSGRLDASGLPTGRGTLTLSKRARYEGHMLQGERSGRGVLLVDEASSSDEEEGEGRRMSSLRVGWRKDEPAGPGVFTEPDGSVVHGHWVNGLLHGPVVEQHSDGSLRFAGAYREGERNGFGVEVRADGGALVGCWTDGAMDGRRCAFLYPCRSGSGLVGEWRQGVMVRAAFVEVLAPEGEALNCKVAMPFSRRDGSKAVRLGANAIHPALKSFVHVAIDHGDAAFGSGNGKQEISVMDAQSLCTRMIPRPRPLSRHFDGAVSNVEGGPKSTVCGADPFEMVQVEVRASKIVNGGLGLYARQDLRPSQVAAFLFGDILSGSDSGTVTHTPPPGVVVDWAVFLGKEWLVPYTREASPASKYAELSCGWRANHGGWRANCTLEPFDHPMVSCAVCVRVRPDTHVSAGDELLVAYEHLPNLADALLPQWYCDLLNQHDEDGYYAHLRHSPPHTVLEVPSVAEPQCTVRVVQHGPWRVMWVGKVEQGMTYHRFDEPHTIVASVVGFDYQRTMVASALALSGSFCAPAKHGASRPCGLLVGLGAGSCAAALHMFGCTVLVLEYDHAVLRAAREAHGLNFDLAESTMRGESGSGGHHMSGVNDNDSYPIKVLVADAMEITTRVSAPVDFVLLDAYDGCGNVPKHLQEADFLSKVSETLSASGFVVANLWNGSNEARRACKAFGRKLRSCVGRVFFLRVEGHEQNIILLSVKGGPDAADDAKALSELRATLASALEGAAGLASVDYALKRSLESCVRSVACVSDFDELGGF